VASLQRKGNSWHCQFVYRRERRTWVLGEVEETEAHAIKGKVEYLLMRIKQHLLDVPAGMDIVTFLQYDGKPPQYAPTGQKPETTFAEFRDRFLKTFSGGAGEDSTLYTAKIHLAHFAATLGETFPMNALTARDLQRHIDRRLKAKNRSGDPISPDPRLDAARDTDGGASDEQRLAFGGLAVDNDRAGPVHLQPVGQISAPCRTRCQRRSACQRKNRPPRTVAPMAITFSE
jgi:hypothetical protein